MKKIFIILIILFAASAVSYSQSFVFTRDSDSIVVSTPADSLEIVSHASVNNTTGSSIMIKLIRMSVNTPSGWQTAICDIQACYGSETDSTDYASYPPGVTDVLSAHFYHSKIPGTGSFIIRAKRNNGEYHDVFFGARYNPIGIKQISSVVTGFSLSQNYPNPFNPVTKINFSVPASNYVDLRVYDLLGREVEVLTSQYMLAGEYEVDFDAGNLASGMYYYRLQSGDNVAVKKMTLVK